MWVEEAESRPGLHLARRRYMKAVVFHGVGDIRLDDVPEPEIQEPTDAIVRLTSSAICGTDLHMVRGTLSGMKEVFPPPAMTFPIGALQQRNLTVKGGNYNHRRHIPTLVGLVASGALDPTDVLTQEEPVTEVIEAYEIFDQRRPAWIKVELLPTAS
jgi:threonine dehydrogenase-like Zn-dependent dehydrogenase